jgi:hypothetical protein
MTFCKNFWNCVKTLNQHEILRFWNIETNWQYEYVGNETICKLFSLLIAVQVHVLAQVPEKWQSAFASTVPVSVSVSVPVQWHYYDCQWLFQYHLRASASTSAGASATIACTTMARACTRTIV